ncbi:unnamed protein product [Closterium sp. Naga37s-1]|nr:unnamed protein product [Closterium sp. Naga37s-1]
MHEHLFLPKENVFFVSPSFLIPPPSPHFSYSSLSLSLFYSIPPVPSLFSYPPRTSHLPCPSASCLLQLQGRWGRALHPCLRPYSIFRLSSPSVFPLLTHSQPGSLAGLSLGPLTPLLVLFLNAFVWGVPSALAYALLRPPSPQSFVGIRALGESDRDLELQGEKSS